MNFIPTRKLDLVIINNKKRELTVLWTLPQKSKKAKRDSIT